MPAGRMIAIAIGVAGSVPPIYLAGAINGARAFQTWAAAQGYETELIIDEADVVTMAVLRGRIEGLLKASAEPIHRIIVYFAGHGLIRELEEGLWLLSDWRTELRAVAVEVLKRRLSMYGARQVAIISDACRSLPSDVEQADLVPDGVLGAGPLPVDTTIAIDKFIAAQDGAAAFMIPGPEPDQDRCLFSGVLVEGLWGVAGLTAQPFSTLQPDKVTSRSLGAYLSSEVSARASAYELTLTPNVSPTFPEGDDYYFSKGLGPSPPQFPPWPHRAEVAGQGVLDIGQLPGAIMVGKTKPFINLGRIDVIRGGGIGGGVGVDMIRGGGISGGISVDTFGGGVDSGGDFDFTGLAGDADAGIDIVGGSDVVPVGPPSPTAPLDRQLYDLPVPAAGPSVSSGFAIAAGGPHEIWMGSRSAAHWDRAGWWSITERDNSNALQYPAPALIELSDGRYAATVALPFLFGSMVRDEYGIAGLIYRDLHDDREIKAPTAAALAALDGGALRADAATDFAVQLRQWKHVDPVLGVISAYLYDAIGDIDSIRRMASFYVQESQAIPYDIALLGGLRGNTTDLGFSVDVPEVPARLPRTDAEKAETWTYCQREPCSGLVAGLWPWMRQGWTFLDHPSDVGSPIVLPGLADLRSGLMRSRFTTLNRSAAEELAKLCGLQPQ